MTSAAVLAGGDDAALQAFLNGLDPNHALAARSIIHAWQAAGGTAQVGRVTVRLCSTGRDGRSFTAATLHAAAPERGLRDAPTNLAGGPTLEIARVLLANHGVGEADWRSWCDDLADLQLRGFDAGAKYPAVALGTLGSTNVARLAQAMRDLGRVAQGQPS